MRNYHEVLRNDLNEVLPPLLDRGDRQAFREGWQAYTRAIGVHAAMEDGVPGAGGGSVAMLNHHFDGIIDATAFLEEHHREHAAQAEVSRALDGPLENLRKAFAAYASLAEAHMKHEEDEMQPLVVKLPDPKAPKFAQWCVSAGIAHGGMEHFLAHGVRSLSRHGSARNPPLVATRVFIHAAHAVFSPEQWAHFGPVMREAAPADLWAEIVDQVPELGAGC